MAFELPNTTKVTITNANPRRELHGEERVRAIDIAFTLSGENTLLDLIEPGLRELHYCNKAMKSGQESLPDIVIPLPNLRHPNLPLSYSYAKGQKWRGYRFIWDWGIEGARVDFSDAVLASLHYEIQEGGSVSIGGTIQYNGEELQDNDVYGELSGLASEGDIFIQLLAPGELLPAKKGYRAGQPDTPATTSSGGSDDLLDELDADAGAGGEDGDGEAQTPEAAFTAAVAGSAA